MVTKLATGFWHYQLLTNLGNSGFVITPTTGSNSLYGAVVSYADGQLGYSTPRINPTDQVKITKTPQPRYAVNLAERSSRRKKNRNKNYRGKILRGATFSSKYLKCYDDNNPQ